MKTKCFNVKVKYERSGELKYQKASIVRYIEQGGFKNSNGDFH